MNDRRFDLRVPVADTVILSWADQTGHKQDVAADMVNISHSGASIRAQRPVKVGATLSIVYQDQEFAGKVTHCVSEGSGYLLGVEFEPGFRWSPRRRK